MAKAKGGLGRGLGALIAAPSTAPSPESLIVDNSRRDSLARGELVGYREIDPSRIVPNKKQPRTEFDAEALAELVASIREVGVLQPPVVRETGPDSYELIMGERRFRACVELGMPLIPVIVRATSDDAMLRDALLENVHRQQLNPLEEAAAYLQLMSDFGTTQEELAARIGKSRPQISNTIRLLNLPSAVQRRVAAGVLSAGHARALLGIEDPAAQEVMANRIVAEGLSVRSVEELVALSRTAEKPKAARLSKPVDPEQQAAATEIATRLADVLETRVKVELHRAKGSITIDVSDLDDLRRIADAILG